MNSRSKKQRIRDRMARTGETYTQAMTAMRNEHAARVAAAAVAFKPENTPPRAAGGSDGDRSQA